MEGFYRMLSEDEASLTYAYSGWDFNVQAQCKTIAKQLDGRFILQKQKQTDLEKITPWIHIQKECQYAQQNMEGIDLFALFSAKRILAYAKQHQAYPKQGRWLA